VQYKSLEKLLEVIEGGLCSGSEAVKKNEEKRRIDNINSI